LIFLLVKLTLIKGLIGYWFWFIVAYKFLLMKLVPCWFFLFLKLVHWFSRRETDFVQETCWVLIFANGTCRVLIFVLSSCSWNLKTSFKELNVCWFLFLQLVKCWFFSWNLLHADYSLRETFTLVYLLVKLICSRN